MGIIPNRSKVLVEIKSIGTSVGLYKALLLPLQDSADARLSALLRPNKKFPYSFASPNFIWNNIGFMSQTTITARLNEASWTENTEPPKRR